MSFFCVLIENIPLALAGWVKIWFVRKSGDDGIRFGSSSSFPSLKEIKRFIWNFVFNYILLTRTSLAGVTVSSWCKIVSSSSTSTSESTLSSAP